jgi:predicted DNA-binding transcriptional regulator YafY
MDCAMNRTDRLLAIILELQARGTQRAEDLAETFEISKRTVYRDVQALSEAGVPVVAVPGQGYSLLEGYFLPPLSFTIDEAALLLLGSEVMARSFDAEYSAFAHDAARKIAGALPERVREETSRLQDAIRFSTFGTNGDPIDEDRLRQIRRAIVRHQVVRLRYYARTGEGETVREVDPLGLIHFRGVWQMVGYCHLRKDIRSFRISRIESLMVLPRSFDRPGFIMSDYLHEKRREEIASARWIVVRALFAEPIARWVLESPSFFMADHVMTPDGLLVTLHVPREQDAIQWLLGWGRHARVLEPESLRQHLAEEIEAMRENFKQPESLLP